MEHKHELPLASSSIDAKIAALQDWRGTLLATIRKIIKRADPDIVEELKWRGVPVWSHAGIVCTGETYKGKVKLTFAHGAMLDDPSGLFNANLDGNVRRAIDLTEDRHIDAAALERLVQVAVARNIAGRSRTQASKAPRHPS